MDPREHLHDLLSGFSHAMLVTRSRESALRARPMALAEIADTGNLWFATGRDSAKVDEIAANPQVCVTFQNGSRYVSISGTARLSTDRARIEKLWREAWRVWYPEGKDDPNLVLLAVDGQTGEFWDNSSLEGLKYLFRAGKAYLTGMHVEIDPEQHHKVAL